MTLIGGGLTFGDPIGLLDAFFITPPGIEAPGGSEDSAATVLSTIQEASGRASVLTGSTTRGIAPGEWDIVNGVRTDAEEALEVILRFVLENIEDAVEVARQLRVMETIAKIYAEALGQWLAEQRRIAALMANLPTVSQALASFRLFGPTLAQVAAMFQRGEQCVGLLLQNLEDPLFRVTVRLGPEETETQSAFRAFLAAMFPLTIPNGLVFRQSSFPGFGGLWGTVADTIGVPSARSPLSTLGRLVEILNGRSQACVRGFANSCSGLGRFAGSIYSLWTGETIADPGVPNFEVRVEEQWGGGFGMLPLLERACVAAEDLGGAIENFEPSSGTSRDLILEDGPRSTITAPQGVGGAVCP